jgi:hypothetical protein
MRGSSLFLDNTDSKSSITIWLDNQPDRAEQYFSGNPYQTESKTSPAPRHAQPESPNKRRKLHDVSSQSMNARSLRTRQPSPHKAARGSQDTTPKPPSLTTLPYPTYPIAFPSDSHSDASSATRSTTSSFRATSTRSARARSPVKRIGDFYLSSVPITLHDFNTPDHPLPLAAKSLVRDLRRISAGRGVIPHDIKERAMLYLEDIIFDDVCFVDPNCDTDRNTPAQHEDLWRHVLDILEAARECRTQHLPEASWNAEAHSRLLRASLSGRWRDRGVWYRDITTAKIADVSLLPTAYSGSSSSTIMQSKMVDYALIIDPTPKLGARIAETLRQEGKSSINQTGAEHVRFAPIGVSFETKRAAVNEDEAHVQLGIWVIAHFARLRQLISNRATEGEEEETLPILPLVIVQGHDWKMMVAEAIVDRDGGGDFKVVILRDLRLGSTDTVLGIYQLIEAVGRLARWVDEEYRPWLENEPLLGGELL